MRLISALQGALFDSCVKRIILRIFISVLVLIWTTSFAFAQDSGFATSAPHALIMDYETGLVLFEKDARDPVAPASMTKIMTAELIFQKIRDGSLSLDTEFTVSEEAWRRGGFASGGSTMGLEVNSTVSVENLLRGVIIQSGNDACIVLDEGIAGSETVFADVMTEHARDIGLTSATFRNATGWPHPEHRISTYDLGRLAERSIRDFPEFYPIYSERDFTWNNIKQSNRNPLLGRFTGAHGLKTGHTEVSGYGLVASAKRGDVRRIVVVNGLGSKSERSKESLRLMQAAFDRFKVETLMTKNAVVGSVDVFMGQEGTVDVAPNSDIQIGYERSIRKNVKVAMISKETVAAPIKRGDHIADLKVVVPGQSEQIYQLFAQNNVKQKSLFGRITSALTAKIRG